MQDQSDHLRQMIEAYRRRAKGYDASGIRGLEKWRKLAVRKLNLKRGYRVVDVGCGTGLNFALLQEAIGQEGKIIAVDLTDAMLVQAQERVTKRGWKNIELVQCDAAQYTFPDRVDGIIATFALSFIPHPAQVIQNGCRALAPGRRWVVLDMAWPDGWPLWLHHGLFFLPSWGITADVIRRRPWQRVRQTLQQQLDEVKWKQLWMGFFYLASGTKPH